MFLNWIATFFDPFSPIKKFVKLLSWIRVRVHVFKIRIVLRLYYTRVYTERKVEDWLIGHSTHEKGNKKSSREEYKLR